MKPELLCTSDLHSELEKKPSWRTKEFVKVPTYGDLFRALVNQKNEQKQRPAARIYSNSRAIRA